MANPVESLSRRVVRTAMQRPRTTRALMSVLPGPLASSAPRSLVGTRVLITGSSSGIGAVAAEKFGAAGAHVLLVARRAGDLDQVAARIRADGGTVDTLPADLSENDDTSRLIETVLSDHGCPDIVVNNAGRSIRRDVLDATDRLHDYQRTMAINYFAPVALTLGFLPAMTERGSGHFINISTWGIPMGAMPKFSAYAASKAAIGAFGRSIAAELRDTGVAVTTVYFPLVRTPMIAPTDEYDTAPALSADDAADWLIHAARFRDAEIMPRVARFLRQVGALRSELADGLVARGSY